MAELKDLIPGDQLMEEKTLPLKIAALLPHTRLYGGVKRFLELGNQFIDKGHSFTIYTPDGIAPDWFNFAGQIRSLCQKVEENFDAVFFTELSMLGNVIHFRAERKIYYIVNPSVKLNRLSRFKEIEFYANSSNLLERSARKYGISAFPALGGLNLKNFNLKDLRIPSKSETFTVMAYGRIAEGRKGTMYVVRACERLRKKGFDVRLLLFDTLVNEKIKAVQEKFTTSVPCEFVLNHPVERNVELYHRADFFVAPEKKTGYANTVVEAMASGTPVLATTSGTRDLLFDQVTGIKITRNSRKIARAIIRLLDNPEMCRKLVINARRNVEKLDWSLLADRIIQNLLEKREPKPRAEPSPVNPPGT